MSNTTGNNIMMFVRILIEEVTCGTYRYKEVSKRGKCNTVWYVRTFLKIEKYQHSEILVLITFFNIQKISKTIRTYVRRYGRVPTKPSELYTSIILTYVRTNLLTPRPQYNSEIGIIWKKLGTKNIDIIKKNLNIHRKKEQWK